MTVARRITTTVALGIGIALAPTAAYAAPLPADPFQPPQLDTTAPGLSGIWKLVGWLTGWASAAFVAAVVVSLIILVAGPPLGFHRASEMGKKGLLISVLGAFLLGGFTVILNGAYAAGGGK